MQEQCGSSKAPPKYKGQLTVDPMMLNCACLFRALKAGEFELSNSHTSQNIILHHLGSSMTKSAIFLQELMAMVGRLYHPTIIEEISWRDMILAECQHQAACVPVQEEVVEDEVTGVVSTVDVTGARAPIISGHMLNTLRIQSISDHNVSSGQKSDTFKMYSVM